MIRHPPAPSTILRFGGFESPAKYLADLAQLDISDPVPANWRWSTIPQSATRPSVRRHAVIVAETVGATTHFYLHGGIDSIMLVSVMRGGLTRFLRVTTACPVPGRPF